MPDNLILNTAHSPGRTYVAFSRDGSTAYTGGCDSLVRIWRTDQGADQEPDTALDADEAITTIATDNDGWLSGSEDSHVRRYAHRGTELGSLVTRTPGVAIRCVAPDPKGRRVAVTSDELTVKVIELDDTSKIKLLDGHTKGVRKATWHPSGTLLTTCGADGKIIVWDVSEDEPKQVKVIEGIIPAVADTASDEFAHDCSVLWHTSGHYFIVATRAHEIVTVSRNTWSKVSTFSSDACSGAMTALALSVNGVYLATACKTGIFVWSTATRRVLVHHSLPTDTVVHQLAFSPTRNLLVWTDSDGALTRWPDLISSTAPDPVKPLASALSSAAAAVPVRRHASPLLFGPDDDDAPGKAQALGGDGDDGVGGVLDEDIDLDRDDDWIIDDLDGGMEDAKEKGRSGAREMVSVTKAQPAFQSGATPFANKRRYLAFNNIGVVEVVDQDSHHIVNVEFHDQTTRKNYHFTDHFKYDLAALGERGIVYACPPENTHLAQITYKPYATWAAQGEWTYALPKGERAVAVAAGGTVPRSSLRARTDADIDGNGYVVVATNSGVVRFFSGGGIQRGPVWAVDGDVVAMVAGRDYVFVVHREGGTSLDGNQNLKYTLCTSDTFRVMHTGRLPVNKGLMLNWIGITDEGAPMIYDSAERVMMLEHFRFTAQGSWVVLLDASTLARRKGKEESYWPVGASKSTLMCIILKGRETYPGFPRPLAQELDLRLPYLDMDGQEAPKEERLSRETILLDSIRDALDDDALTNEEISKAELDLDKEVILLIQLACKQDRLQRALDAVKLLHHTASFDAAAKVANFYHLVGLEEKIGILKAERLDSDRLREDRERRRGWKRAAGPVRPMENELLGQTPASTRPFQNINPAPAVNRPRLTPATPSTDPSPFSRKPAMSSISGLSSRTTESHLLSSAEGKRKRDGGNQNDEDDVGALCDANPKRRALEDDFETDFSARETSQPRSNPFAKKPREGNTNSANPFLRKVTSNKSMHKSDSFFEKVDAAEDENEKRPRPPKKTKATDHRQATLFNLPPVVPEPKKAAPRKKTSKKQNNDEKNQTLAKASEHSAIDDATQDRDATMVIDVTQGSEATMVDCSPTSLTATQVETQLLDMETQPLDTETQPLDISIGEDNGDSQVTAAVDIEADDDADPIDWPASPPPRASVELPGLSAD